MTLAESSRHQMQQCPSSWSMEKPAQLSMLEQVCEQKAMSSDGGVSHSVPYQGAKSGPKLWCSAQPELPIPAPTFVALDSTCTPTASNSFEVSSRHQRQQCPSSWSMERPAQLSMLEQVCEQK